MIDSRKTLRPCTVMLTKRNMKGVERVVTLKIPAYNRDMENRIQNILCVNIFRC